MSSITSQFEIQTPLLATSDEQYFVELRDDQVDDVSGGLHPALIILAGLAVGAAIGYLVNR